MCVSIYTYLILRCAKKNQHFFLVHPLKIVSIAFATVIILSEMV